MKHHRNDHKAELLVACSVLFATLGQVVLKLGSTLGGGWWARPLPLLHGHGSAGIVFGLLIYGCGTVLWIAAVSRHNISYLYPLGSLSYIFVMLCGHYLLGEALRPGRVIGVLIMACGIVLLMSDVTAQRRERA